MQLGKKQLLMSGSGLAMAVCVFIGINIIFNLWFTSLRLDLTDSKLFTLSEGTINILQALEEPMHLKLYVSRKALTEYPLLANYAQRVRDMLLEYESRAGGSINLSFLDPEPFSEEEDQAVAEGLQNIPVGGARIQAYFGLVGVNSTNDREIIPFLAPGREASLEYEISKMIYNLANPERRVVGLLSSLPLFGEGIRPEPWSIITVMQEFFEIRDLSQNPTAITQGLDVLLLIHPKDLDDATLYAIDQYALQGGKLMALVDPLSDYDLSNPPEGATDVLPDMDSDLATLFNAWGIKLIEGKVVGDLQNSMRVQHQGARGIQEIEYLPWLHMKQANFNSDDFSTSELNRIHIGSGGAIEKTEDSEIEFQPLISSSTKSTLLERDLVIFQRSDPQVLLQAFKAEDKEFVLAARLSGPISSAFPDGITVPDPVDAPGEEAGDDSAEQEESGEETEPERIKDPDHTDKGELHAIVVADTDLLQDRFWIRVRSILNIRIPQTIANNGDFIVNSLENLSGSTDLISLRTRGEYERPFTRVEEIRREAETRFRDEEQRLKEKLETTEARIKELQQEDGEAGAGGQILTPAQAREINQFKEERLKTRKQLRAVQHGLQKDIEALGSRMRFINIALLPLTVILASIALHFIRKRRRQLQWG